MNDVDPFDLPDWLGDGQRHLVPETGVRDGHLVTGRAAPARTGDELACDLLAVDEAYPAPVVDDAVRTRAHQAWRHGQILLVEREGRLTLAVPGTGFTADAGAGRARPAGQGRRRLAGPLRRARCGSARPPAAGRARPARARGGGRRPARSRS